jgi:hypothetical protein
MSSLLGLLVLIADIWAIIQIINAKASTGTKILWVLLVLFLPLIGLIIWYLMGPGKKK